jgi:4-amino-4-deoxy-L-arabinose transferase-like glycosyltransferase
MRSRIQNYWSRDLFPGRSSSSASSNLFWPALLALSVICCVLLIPNLSYPLLEPDEGRYAEISREMFATGEWIVPTLYFQPYFDKPPMFYWLIASSFRFFGVSPHSARMVPALAAFLTVTATFLFGARVAGVRIGFMGALILILSAGFVNLGRVLILDGVLTLAVSLSLFGAFEAIRGGCFHWQWWLFSALSCAAGVLIKGPIAFVLLAPPIGLHCWLTEARMRPRWWAWMIYVAVVVGISAPWFVAIMVREPNYASHFLWRHHVLRFFGKAFHPQPVWYYLPVVCIAFFPWSLLFVPLGRYPLSSMPAIRGHRTRMRCYRRPQSQRPFVWLPTSCPS